jgi:hypothetical protein
MQIKSLENPNRLTIELYTPPKQHSFVKHTTSARTSSKVHTNQSDVIAILDQQANVLHQYEVFLFFSKQKDLIHNDGKYIASRTGMNLQ